MSQSSQTSSPHIPPEAYQLGQAPISIHTGTNRERIRSGILLGAFGLLFTGLAVLALINEEYLGILIMGGIALFFLWIVAVILKEMIHDRNLLIVVMPQGFLVSRAGGSTIFRWADIDKVWQSVSILRSRGGGSTATHRYTVERRDGTRIVLTDNVSDVARLGEAVQQNVTQNLLPDAVESFQAGQSISFDALALSSQGIAKGQKFLPWDQVREIRLANGQVSVWQESRQGLWVQVPTAQIANLYVFISLVNQVIGITT